MITAVKFSKQLVPENQDLEIEHEAEEYVQVLTTGLMGPDLIYTYLVIGRHDDAPKPTNGKRD